MIGLLWLPDDLIEAVGKQVISKTPYHQIGLRDWCRITSTCKQLWHMQLPGSAFKWFVDFDITLEGGSKVTPVLFTRIISPSLCNLVYAHYSRCTLDIAAGDVDTRADNHQRSDPQT